MTSSSLLQVRNLHKSYGSVPVLNGIDLDVQAGELVSVIGPSGSGKSTLLRCCNRMEDATRGEVRVEGHDIYAPGANLNRLRERVGMVFQAFNLYPHLDVLGNVTLALRKVKKMARDAAEHTAMEALARVGMEHKARVRPTQLSGGQQQRVAIARALAMEPAVLLCDEITSALDPELVGEVLRVVESLAQEGMTLLMVTHEMNFARRVSNRVIFMHQGRVHEMGPPADIFGKPQTPELQQFLSSLHD